MSTLRIPADLKARLNAMKIHRRETYADVIERILEDSQELGPETQRDIARSLREFKAGKYKPLAQVKRELGL